MEYEPYPLDVAILRLLPEEGSKLGYHHIAATAKALKSVLFARDPTVTSAAINGRLRTLKAVGLVMSVRVLPAGGGAGWQVTQRGRDVALDNLHLLNEEER